MKAECSGCMSVYNDTRYISGKIDRKMKARTAEKGEQGLNLRAAGLVVSLCLAYTLVLAGPARGQGEPTGIPAHNFHHHCPVMGSRGCMDAIDSLGYDGNSRVESEGLLRAVEIVVDGLGYPNDVQSQA